MIPETPGLEHVDPGVDSEVSAAGQGLNFEFHAMPRRLIEEPLVDQSYYCRCFGQPAIHFTGSDKAD
jgi:hypothetical protein